MVAYKEFQFGTLLAVSLGLTEILMVYLFVNHLGTSPMNLGIFLFISVIMGISFLLFYGMTTVVYQDRIAVWFGVGIIRKSVDLATVHAVEIVKNPWYYGWGIRFIPHGMLYNVSGSDGVELKLEGGKIIRIGTKDAIQLHSALSAVIRRGKGG